MVGDLFFKVSLFISEEEGTLLFPLFSVFLISLVFNYSLFSIFLLIICFIVFLIGILKKCSYLDGLNTHI